MILGAYRNPPYRSPTPRSATSASPPPNSIGSSNRNQSPKRKRLQASSTAESSPPAPVAALRVDTGYNSDGSVDNGQNSPRSKVAERLNRLDIRQADGSPTSSQSPRKKLKRNHRLGEVQETPQQHLSLEIPDSVGDDLLEIRETPGADDRIPSPTPPGSWQDNGTMKVEPRPTKRMLSPPPPSPATDAMETDNYDPTSLTWQDDEITGHEITSPDDDGEGINGVGFKPTPAIAQVRSQKRRQQVNDWKAREARDARQRRMDRRRGMGLDGATTTTKRHVRFMDSG